LVQRFPGLGGETSAISGGALLLALLVLRVSPDWARGVIGGGDAWQNIWNLRHVDRFLRGLTPLFFSDQVWAPDGATLLAHTLAPAVAIPGAILARFVGLFAAYNALVALSFVLAAAASYRLSRRLGAGATGSALGAVVFAFAPQRMARALGHLNLLWIGWIPLAIEGLVLACRGTGRGERTRGIVQAAVALALLGYTDWYLSTLGILAAASFAFFEVVRRGNDRRPVLLRLALVAFLAVLPVLPLAAAVARHARAEGTVGHDPRNYSVSVTSLFVPSRIQLLSRLTPSLTLRERSTVEEGSHYLGFAALASLAFLLLGKRRPRDLDFALLAGSGALALSLGPVLWVFQREYALPLPYSLLEKVLPDARLGGCVSRFQMLAFLPLSLAVAFVATRLLSGGRRGRATVMAGSLVLAVETLPASPGCSVWPFDPPDASMRLIADSPVSGAVLDVDPGGLDLIHQLQHGRPQLFGYLSRSPTALVKRRLDDPVLGPFLDRSRPFPALPRAAVAALLRHRWNIAFVISPEFPEFAVRAGSLGLPEVARSDRGDRAIVYQVPLEAPAPVSGIDFAEVPPARRGVFVSGLQAPGRMASGEKEVGGAWTGEHVEILAPLVPGVWQLRVAYGQGSPPRVVVRWGEKQVTRTVDGTTDLPIEIAASDLAEDGMGTITLDLSPPGRNERGQPTSVFLVSLSRSAKPPVRSSGRTCK
jgi:hypothetical protein